MEKLLSILDLIKNEYFKLIIITGPFGSGKTRILKKLAERPDFTYLNMNLELTNRLMGIKESDYDTRAQELVKEMIDDYSDTILLIDNIEIFFSSEVGKIDPVSAFKNLARDKIIVISIPGKQRGEKIIYSSLGRKDYLEMDISDLTVIDLGGVSL
jgi:AAA+ ATPase superfamily predicted ATPase